MKNQSIKSYATLFLSWMLFSARVCKWLTACNELDGSSIAAQHIVTSETILISNYYKSSPVEKRYIEGKLGIFSLLWDCLWQPTICQLFQGSTVQDMGGCRSLSKSWEIISSVKKSEKNNWLTNQIYCWFLFTFFLNFGFGCAVISRT